MRHPKWLARVDDPGDERGVTPSRQLPGQHVHAGAGHDVQREKRDVVDERRVARQPLERRREQRHPDQMIRVQQRVAIGKKVWRVPDSAQPVAETIGIPRERPRSQHGVAEVAGQTAGEPEHQRVGRGNRETCEGEQDPRRFGALRHRRRLYEHDSETIAVLKSPLLKNNHKCVSR